MTETNERRKNLSHNTYVALPLNLILRSSNKWRLAIPSCGFLSCATLIINLSFSSLILAGNYVFALSHEICMGDDLLFLLTAGQFE